MREIQIVSRIAPLLEYIKKQQENRKVAKSVEIGATLFFISFFLLFAIKPTALTISALIGDIKSKEILVKQMRKKINEVVEAQNRFAQVQGNYKLIDSCLPDSPRYFHAISQISQAFSTNNESVNDIGIILSSKLKNQPYLKSYSANFDQAVPFPVSLDILSRLLSNRRLFTIKNINFGQIDSKKTNNPADISADPSAINFRFTTNIYYWNQNQP